MGFWRSTAEMLAPAMLCVGVFCTIPAENLKRQCYNILFKPLIASVLLGMSSSVAAIFYGFWQSRQATLEAVKSKMDKEESQKIKRMKGWLLIPGVMCTLLALVLRVGLTCTEETRHLFICGCIEVVLPFIVLCFDLVDMVANMLA